MTFTATAEQQQIFAHRQGLAKVFAGPGTGKTTTLVNYVEKLAADGFKQVLVLCFNKEVRKEIQLRITKMQVRGVAVHTFHSLAYHAIKPRNLPKNLEQVQRILQKKIYQQFLKAKLALDALDEFADFVARQKAFYPMRVPPNEPLSHVFKLFEQQRKHEGLLFYDDWLQSYAYQLEQRGVPFYDAVLVDEAQDLNPIQFSIFELLTTHSRVCMLVGDVDQTLYQWRQAHPEMFLTCQIPHLPECKFTLSQTFRYGHQQALAAQQLIHQNVRRHPLLTVSNGAIQTAIKLEQYEAPVNRLVLQLEQLQKLQPSATIAIIAPTWVALEPVQMALLLKRLPYDIKADKRLNLHDGFKLINALGILNAPNYNSIAAEQRVDAIHTIFTTPYHPIKMEFIQTLATQFGQLPRERVLHHIASLQQSVEKPVWRTLGNLRIAITLIDNNTVSAEQVLSEYYTQTDLINHIQNDALLSEERRNDKCFHYQQLVILAVKKAQSFTEFASFIKGVFRLKAEAKPSNIVLGTVHFHKWLEYDHVFVMARESWGQEPQKLEEEERRSLYVAITRAKQQTTILCDNNAKLAELMQLEHAQQAYSRLMGNTLLNNLSNTCQRYLQRLAGVLQSSRQVNNSVLQTCQQLKTLS
ncbi:MAG: ATP-dependent helicase [Paraglaciecola sp.]|nr:ATP-dependent helicase [Paraglaciecola sp.]